MFFHLMFIFFQEDETIKDDLRSTKENLDEVVERGKATESLLGFLYVAKRIHTAMEENRRQPVVSRLPSECDSAFCLLRDERSSELVWDTWNQERLYCST